MEVAALARHHETSVEETRDRADDLLDGLRAELPPQAYAEAEARGRERDLEATMRELLVALGPAAGWGAMPGASSQAPAARPAGTGGQGDA